MIVTVTFKIEVTALFWDRIDWYNVHFVVVSTSSLYFVKFINLEKPDQSLWV